jgi:hypothetical protein
MLTNLIKPAPRRFTVCSFTSSLESSSALSTLRHDWKECAVFCYTMLVHWAIAIKQVACHRSHVVLTGLTWECNIFERRSKFCEAEEFNVEKLAQDG